MNIEQLKSGSYRIRQMYKGKKYSITIDHKPTKKEALQIMAELLNEDITNYSIMPFKRACEEYLKIKSNVLSPSTKRGYNGYIKTYSDRFSNLPINQITQVDIQKEINDLSVGHSPKYVANLHGFISAIMQEFRPNLTLHTKLPQKKKSDSYIPSTDDVKKLLKAFEGSKHELGIKLAICGLRRSELCALTPEDLSEDNILSINKAWVQDENKNWVVKEYTKTDAGTRQIILPQDYATLYRQTTPNKDNHVYRYAPNTLYEQLTNMQKQLGIPTFKLHSCRAYYCSLLHSMGFSDATVMELGGWKSEYTMKNVYRHSLQEEKKKAMQKSADAIKDL